MELKENTTIVVLGASGDLAKKKTVRSFTSVPSAEAILTSLRRTVPSPLWSRKPTPKLDSPRAGSVNRS